MLLTKKTVVTFLSALFILTLGIYINRINLSVIKITDIDKCPACYGISMCQDINDNKFTLEYSDFFTIFNNLLSVKNVYFGIYNNDTKVVLKKLAQANELEAFDEMICTTSELLELCSNNPTKRKTKTNFYNLILSELANNDMTDPNNKIRLCPTTTKLSELLSNIQTDNTVKIENYYKFLWTTIKINPEPIILQILSSKENWPTTKYYGACGRLAIEEYIGLPLSAFFEVSWIRRVKIASSLLDAAYKFTFKNPKLAFYLTDISIDNIAVNKQDKAIFVDLENIIIVDKEPPSEVLNTLKTWDETYINDLDVDCDDCFAYSPADICSHKISDHNYYAVCQHILSQNKGFLHDPPSDILQEYPELFDLLKQCSRVPNAPKSRIDIGIQLKNLLDVIIKNTK